MEEQYLPTPQHASVGVELDGSKVVTAGACAVPISGCRPHQDNGTVLCHRSTVKRVEACASLLEGGGGGGGGAFVRLFSVYTQVISILHAILYRGVPFSSFSSSSPRL